MVQGWSGLWRNGWDQGQDVMLPCLLGEQVVGTVAAEGTGSGHRPCVCVCFHSHIDSKNLDSIVSLILLASNMKSIAVILSLYISSLTLALLLVFCRWTFTSIPVSLLKHDYQSGDAYSDFDLVGAVNII